MELLERRSVMLMWLHVEDGSVYQCNIGWISNMAVAHNRRRHRVAAVASPLDPIPSQL